MIGGHDIVVEVPGGVGPAVLDFVVRCVLRRWPHGIVQDATTGTRYPSYRAIPFGHLSDVFVYRDEGSYETWRKVGADPGNVNGMVHLIARAGRLTLVVDDPKDPATNSLVREVRGALDPASLWAMA